MKQIFKNFKCFFGFHNKISECGYYYCSNCKKDLTDYVKDAWFNLFEEASAHEALGRGKAEDYIESQIKPIRDKVNEAFPGLF